MLVKDQEAAVKEQFESLDVNGDGYITESDYAQTAERACNNLGLPTNSGAGAKLVSAMRTWGKTLIKDSDTSRDGAISRAEYVDALHRRTSDDPGYADRNKPLVEALWEIMDADHDGTISKDEFRRVEKAFGFSDSYINDAFAKIDQNRDNVLSKDETVRYLASWGARS